MNKFINFMKSFFIKEDNKEDIEQNIFDFTDLVEKEIYEIDIGKFFELAENDIIEFDNDNIATVVNQAENIHGFHLKGVISINNNEGNEINSFFKDKQALKERIEKIENSYDKSLPITFTGVMKKYIRKHKMVNRSEYGTGCDSFSKIIEYKGRLCFIPEENECFIKCVNYIAKVDLTNEYRDFIKQSLRRKNIMTRAKIQPFFRKYNIDLGIYDRKQQRILPLSVRRRNICLCLHEKHFCLIWKTNETTFTDAIDELEKNFKYVSNQINNDILSQVKVYKFPKQSDMNCMDSVFSFDIETTNVDYKLYCEPYAVGCYHLNRLKYRYKRDLLPCEIEQELSHVHVFGYENKNPVFDMIKYVAANYKGRAKYYIDKNGEYKISCYKFTFIAHNASGFDNALVINSLPKHIMPSVVHTSRGFLKVNFKIDSDGDIPPYMKFICSRVHIAGELRKIEKEYNVQPELLKSNMEHNQVNIHNYKDLEHIWKPYLKLDILGLASLIAKHGNDIQSITKVSFKNSLTESSLAWSTFGKYLGDKTFYTPKNKYVRDFIHKTVHGGRVFALKRKYESDIFPEIVNILRKHLKSHTLPISDLFEEYYKRIDILTKQYTEQYDKHYADYRDINKADKEKYINNKLSKLEISKELNNLDKKDRLVSSDYVSLYPSAMVDSKSKFSKIETAKAILPESSDLLCELFNTGNWSSLNKNGFFKVLYHSSKENILQHLPINEKVYNPKTKKEEQINVFRNGEIIDHVTSIDLEEIVRVGGRVLKFFEGFICDQLEYSPFYEIINDLNNMRNKYKKDGLEILQKMCKQIMLAIYGACIRKDIDIKLQTVSQHWMEREFDDLVKDWYPLDNGNFMVHIKDHEGVDDRGVSKKINSQPFHFGAEILSHSKRIMNDVILTIDGFKNNNIYYGDTDSIYIHNDDYNKLKEHGLIGKNLGQSKNDYSEGAGIIFGLFLAPKIKYCIVLDENGILSQNTTFKGYNQNLHGLSFKDYIDLELGNTISNMSKIKWKREFGGIKIPHRKHDCSNCNESLLCDSCKRNPKMNCFQCELAKACDSCLSIISRKTEYNADINKMKREPANENGDMLPYYKIY